MMLYSFGHVQATCALGLLCCAPGAGAHKHRLVALKMLKMLLAFGRPVQHMTQTSCNNVARCCVEMFPAFGQPLIGSLSTRVFETRAATGSELFSLLTCLHTITVTLPSIFSPLEMFSIKMWETPLSWNAKCSLPVALKNARA